MRPYAAWAICCAAFATLAQMAAGRGGGPKPPPPPPPGDPAGPPPAASDPTPPPLTAKEVWTYAVTGCLDRDIADRFLVDENRIAREFADVLRSARALRRFNLRKHQTLVAFSGKTSSSMLQFLGRIELNQVATAGEAGLPEPIVADGETSTAIIPIVDDS